MAAPGSGSLAYDGWVAEVNRNFITVRKGPSAASPSGTTLMGGQQVLVRSEHQAADGKWCGIWDMRGSALYGYVKCEQLISTSAGGEKNKFYDKPSIVVTGLPPKKPPQPPKPSTPSYQPHVDSPDQPARSASEVTVHLYMTDW